jgi:hypothetical protein
MKKIGIGLILVGVFLLIFFLTMDTSVALEFSDGRVHNLGLMRQQQNGVIVSALMLIIGVLVVGFSVVSVSKEAIEVEKNEIKLEDENLLKRDRVEKERQMTDEEILKLSLVEKIRLWW